MDSAAWQMLFAGGMVLGVVFLITRAVTAVIKGMHERDERMQLDKLLHTERPPVQIDLDALEARLVERLTRLHNDLLREVLSERRQAAPLASYDALPPLPKRNGELPRTSTPPG